ncbi:MAG: nitrite reductase small subunit NirD [Bryobacteraceae bacterium]|nr:nitrite reductase small subunit NirD [Bryobacteraceae bacterium]
MSWIRITETENVPLREGRSVQLGRREIAIFHLPDRFVAIDNMCPHNGGPLCDGIVKGTTVVCPLHGWNICLESGRVTRPDVPIGVRTYPVRVVDGVIEMEVRQQQSEGAAA